MVFWILWCRVWEGKEGEMRWRTDMEEEGVGWEDQGTNLKNDIFLCSPFIGDGSCSSHLSFLTCMNNAEIRVSIRIFLKNLSNPVIQSLRSPLSALIFKIHLWMVFSRSFIGTNWTTMRVKVPTSFNKCNQMSTMLIMKNQQTSTSPLMKRRNGSS